MFIEKNRLGGRAMTVKEMQAALNEFDDDMLVVFHAGDSCSVCETTIRELVSVHYCKFTHSICGVDGVLATSTCAECYYSKRSFCHVTDGLGEHMVRALEAILDYGYTTIDVPPFDDFLKFEGKK